MRFLFFDTECANCHQGVGKICEFGYVLTDDKFRVLKSDNLLINPQSNFNVYGFKQAGIVFAHPYREYYKHPTLDKRYDEIKRLMTDKRTIAVGYSTDCDANYLLGDLRRNKLETFNFRFLDVAKLYRDLTGKETSLDVMYEDAEKLDIELIHHEARSDSYMTMAVLKRFLKETDTKVKNLENAYPEAFGEVFNGRIVTGSSAFKYTKGDRMTPCNKKVLDNFVKNYPCGQTNPKVVNRSICFARDFEHTHFSVVLAASKAIIEGGGRYSNVISRADTIVYPPDEDFRKIRKMCGRKAKFVKLEDLCELLDLPKNSLDEEEVNVDLVLAALPDNTEWYKAFLKENRIYAKKIKKILKRGNPLYTGLKIF